MKKARVDEVADIRVGYYRQAEKGGQVPYLQVRQFDENGLLVNKIDEFINLDAEAKKHLLMDGDLLFVGKGNRLFTWCYEESFGLAVASSAFFVLSLDKQRVLPGYLTAILNASSSKTVFKQMGGGSNIFSIRKSELGAFEIPLPPMQQQNRIAELAALHQQEIELSQKLIAEKQNLYTAIISKLIK